MARDVVTLGYQGWPGAQVPVGAEDRPVLARMAEAAAGEAVKEEAAVLRISVQTMRLRAPEAGACKGHVTLVSDIVQCSTCSW